MKKEMYIELDGNTSKELWGNLLDLLSAACECKNDEGEGVWPELLSKSDKGLIKVVDLGKGNTSGNQYHKDAEIKRLKAMIYDAKVIYNDTNVRLEDTGEKMYQVLSREEI